MGFRDNRCISLITIDEGLDRMSRMVNTKPRYTSKLRVSMFYKPGKTRLPDTTSLPEIDFEEFGLAYEVIHNDLCLEVDPNTICVPFNVVDMEVSGGHTSFMMDTALSDKDGGQISAYFTSVIVKAYKDNYTSLRVKRTK